VKEAREALKLLKLERQILGSAVTTIYDSQLKGVITEAERDRMLEKYKVDLKDLEKRIEVNQQVVDLYDLEIEREDATRNYKAKLAEIDARLKDLKSGTPSKTHNPTEAIERTSQLSDDKSAHHNEAERQPSSAPEEKHKEEEEISDAEKRVEKIRAEILQAMDRLEQIEAEG
jgi:chromosome segregation ATPase